MIGNISGSKFDIYERDWSKFDREKIDWEDLLKIDELNADNSTKIYLDSINMLLDPYTPFKKINKYKLKFKSKSWITLGLRKSISVKNKLLTNFINKEAPTLKEEFHTNHKKYRNLLSTLSGADPEILKKRNALCRPPWFAGGENFRFQMV